MIKMTIAQVQEIVKNLEEGVEAINTLEKLSNNKFLYDQRKKRIQTLADKLTSQYGLKEYIDQNARDKQLEKDKKEADDNWDRKNGTGI